MSGCPAGVLIDFSDVQEDKCHNNSSKPVLVDIGNTLNVENFSSKPVLVDKGNKTRLVDVPPETGVGTCIPSMNDCIGGGMTEVEGLEPMDGGDVSRHEAADKEFNNDSISDSEFIDAETFDFDLPTTPESTSDSLPDGDDEEVFFGPVGFTERCAQSVVLSSTKDTKPPSPPNEKQMAEIFREANAVANRIAAAGSSSKVRTGSKGTRSCTKQLKLGEELFKKEALSSLLKSASGTHVAEDEKENYDTENSCDNRTDIVAFKLPLDTDSLFGGMSKESLLFEISNEGATKPVSKNIVTKPKTKSKEHLLIDIDDDIEMLEESSQNSEEVAVDIPEEERSRSSKRRSKQSKERLLVDISDEVEHMDVSSGAPGSGSDGSDSTESPTKRHNRSGTFTLSKTPHDQLPEDKRRSLPVVGQTEVTAVKEDQPLTNGSGLRRSNSRLKQPSKIRVPAVKQPDSTAQASNVDNNTKPVLGKGQVKSKLAVPKLGSLLPSKLKPVGTGPVNSASKLSQQPNSAQKHDEPQNAKSAIPGTKSQVSQPSKLQLMRSSRLQKPVTAVSKNPASEQKKGPMKAFAPVQERPGSHTPSKAEKSVKPKNLSSSFSTPKSGSTKDSPVSSVKRRQSFLPTPTKSRLSSVGSLPSPCGSRTSSTSSTRSMESPRIGTRSISKSKPPIAPTSNSKRRSLPVATTSNGKRRSLPYNHIDLIDDSSPSAMRPKRQLVTNTPNVPMKAPVSRWSPVQRKKPLDLIDQATMCTKKMKR